MSQVQVNDGALHSRGRSERSATAGPVNPSRRSRLLSSRRAKTLSLALMGLPASVVLLSNHTARAGTSGVWTNPVSGDVWSDTASWNNGIGSIVADGADATADFSTLTLTADNTVTMDAAHTLGYLNFADQGGLHNWNIAGANTLTLQTTVTGAIPTIKVVNDIATIQDSVAGSQGFIKSGAGTLILSTNADSYTGNVFVQAGTLSLQIGQAGAAFQLSGGSTLTTNQALSNTVYADTGSSTYNGASFTGALLGNGTLTLSGGISNQTTWGSFAAGFGGTVTMNGYGGRLSGGAGVTYPFATLDLEGTGESIYVKNSGTTTVLGGLEGNSLGVAGASSSGTANWEVGVSNTNTTFAGTFTTGGAGGTLSSLTKVGTGTLTLTGASTTNVAGTVSADGGTIKMDYSLNPTSVWYNGAALNFYGGSLYLLAKNSGTSTQQFGNVTVNGYGGNSLIVDPNGGAGISLALGTLSDTNAGGTLNIQPPNVTLGSGTATITSVGLKGADGTFGERFTYGSDWLSGGAVSNTSVLYASSTSTLALAGVANGNEVVITGTAPTGLTANTTYYAVNASGGSFQVSSTYGGAAIAFTTSGSTTVSTEGALTAYTGYNTTLPSSGSVATTDYYNVGGGALTAAESVNSLKLSTTAAGQSLDLKGFALTLTNGGLLFAGSSNYTIGVTAGSTLKSNTATNSELDIQQLGTGTLTISAVIANGNGASTVTKAGFGTLVLSGVNTYTGQTYLNGGVTSISADSNLGAVATGATLNMDGGTLQATGTFTLDNAGANKRAVTIEGGGGTFDVTAGNTLTVDGVINDVNYGPLTKTDSGTLVLSGANTYTGATTISGGVLSVASLANGGATSGIGNSINAAPALVLDGGTLKYTGAAASTDRTFTLTNNGGGLDASGTAALNFTSILPEAYTGSGNRTFTLTGSSTASNTFAAPLGDASTSTGASGSVSLVKSGAGTWVLPNTYTYTGNTTVSAGKLFLTNATSSNPISSSAIVNVAGGATLDVTGLSGSTLTLGTQTLSGGGTINGNLTSVSTTVFSPGTVLSGNAGSGILTVGNLSLAAGSTINLGLSTTVATNSLINANALTLPASGTLTLNLYAPNTITAFTSSGTFDIFQYMSVTPAAPTPASLASEFTIATPLPSGISATYGTIAGSGGSTYITLTLAGASAIISQWQGPTSDANWSDSANWTAGVPHAAGDQATFAGAGAGPVTLDANETVGSITFSNGNSASGYTITGSNTLTLDNAGAGASIVVSQGSHVIQTPVYLNDTLSVQPAAGTQIGLSGNISSFGAGQTITLSGPGTLVLSGNNTYGPAAGAFGTYLNSGTLQVGSNSALSTGDVSVNAQATLQAGAAGLVVGNNFNLSAGLTVDTQANTFTLNGVVSGTGTLTKIGSGLLALSASNTYTGGTVLTAGIIQINSAASLGASSGNLNFSGGSLQLGATIATTSRNYVIASGQTATIDTNGFNLTDAGVISSVGATNTTAADGLTKNGLGTLTLSGNNTFTGQTLVNNGTLTIGSTLALQSSTLNYTTGLVNFGTIATATFGGLTGTGTLNLNNSTGAAVALTVGANNTNNTFTGTLTGGGSLIQAGTGTTIIGSGTAGAANYSGATTVNVGSLQIGGVTNMSAGASNIGLMGTAPSANLTIADSAQITTTGIISLGLTGANGNNYANATQLLLENNSKVTAGSFRFSDGGVRLQGTGAVLTLQNSASLTINGTFDLNNTLNGTSAASNDVVNLNGGTLAVKSIIQSQQSTLHQSTFNFGGGVLVALASDGASAFFPAPTAVTTPTSMIVDVQAGGAIINTNGFNDTIAATLLHGTGTTDGGLTKNGLGTLRLTAANSYNGLTTINQGTLNINGEYALGGSVYGGMNFNGGTLQYANPIPTTPTNGSGDITETSALVFKPVTVSAGGATIDTNGNAIIYAGPFGNSGSGSLVIADSNVSAGSLTINMATTYTGLTNVASGTLNIGNNVSTGGLISPTVLVGSAGILTVRHGASISSTTALTDNGIVNFNNASQTIGTLNGTGALKLSSNQLKLSPNLGAPLAATIGTLSLSGGTGAWTSSVDLTNNAMVIHSGANLATASQVFANTSNQVAQGYAGGVWQGSGGIFSSTAANDPTHLTALGVVINDNGFNTGTSLYTTFENTPVANNDVLIKYTYYGDADLSGAVDGSDYSRIDTAYGFNQTNPTTPMSGWFNGDFNYDGVVDGSDYTLMDNAFNNQGTQFTAQIAAQVDEVGSSAVPEPTTLGLLGIGAVGLLGRRRNRIAARN